MQAPSVPFPWWDIGRRLLLFSSLRLAHGSPGVWPGEEGEGVPSGSGEGWVRGTQTWQGGGSSPEQTRVTGSGVAVWEATCPGSEGLLGLARESVTLRTPLPRGNDLKFPLDDTDVRPTCSYRDGQRLTQRVVVTNETSDPEHPVTVGRGK